MKPYPFREVAKPVLEVLVAVGCLVIALFSAMIARSIGSVRTSDAAFASMVVYMAAIPFLTGASFLLGSFFCFGQAAIKVLESKGHPRLSNLKATLLGPTAFEFALQVPLRDLPDDLLPAKRP